MPRPTASSTAASSGDTRSRVRTRAPAGAATTNGAAIARSLPTRHPLGDIQFYNDTCQLY